MADLGSELDTYWVVPGRLLAGEYPGDPADDRAMSKLRELLSARVGCFVDLTEVGESSLRPYALLLDAVAADGGLEIEYRRMPIRDLSAPTRQQLQEILNFVDSRLKHGQTVYVHCWGGVGRTGVVVGCFLARHGLATGSAAIERIAQLRRNTRKAVRVSPETKEQSAVVVMWNECE